MNRRPRLDQRDAGRLLVLAGVLVALAGLVGYWFSRTGGTPLTKAQSELLAVGANELHLGLVVAGRDVFYDGPADPVYGEDGRIVCWIPRGTTHSYGVNTDTILYVGITGSRATMIFLPRDLFVGPGRAKINSVVARQGAEGLERAVAELLGVPVDRHLIVNIDIFEGVVDALGGVTVDVPVRMYHRDCAAGLTIDLPAGRQHLAGAEAAHFVRYRSLPRGDIDRIDNIKVLGYALLSRLKELNVGAVGRLPQLLELYYDEVETDLDLPFIVAELMPLVGSLEIGSSGTLPTVESVRGGTGGLEIDPRAVEQYLALAFGGTARSVAVAPETRVMITNSSGTAGLDEWYREQLVRLGVPSGLLSTRSGRDEAVSRVRAPLDRLADAEYYASLLGVGSQQVERFGGNLSGYGIEIVLGEDAGERFERSGRAL